MQEFCGFYRTGPSWLRPCLALATVLLASACAPGSSSRLTGVGCADPSCNEAMPETRKVLGCIGEACSEPPPPAAAKKVAAAAGGEREAASSPVASAAGGERGTASPQGAASDSGSGKGSDAKTDGDESSDWDLKVYYEPYQRP